MNVVVLRRPLWRVFAALALAGLLLAAAVVALLVWLVPEAADAVRHGLSVTLDGERLDLWVPPFDGWLGHAVSALVALAVGAAVLMFVVPLVLLAVGFAIVLAIGLGLGLPLLLAGGVLALVLSPLWLMLLLLWLLVRPRRPVAAA